MTHKSPGLEKLQLYDSEFQHQYAGKEDDLGLPTSVLVVECLLHVPEAARNTNLIFM